MRMYKVGPVDKVKKVEETPQIWYNKPIGGDFYDG
jgi:hypothetical protein